MTVHHWTDDSLNGRACLRTSAHGEMLIRHCVIVIWQLATELSLDLSVTCIQSSENHGDVLTRVLEEWVQSE